MAARVKAKNADVVCYHRRRLGAAQRSPPLLQADDPVCARLTRIGIARKLDQEDEGVRMAADALLGQRKRALHLADDCVRIEAQPQLLFRLGVGRRPQTRVLNAAWQQVLRAEVAHADERAVEEVAGGLEMIGTLLWISGNLGRALSTVALTDGVKGAHEIADRAAESRLHCGIFHD